jgi:membrane protein DedA with SNARE-associated domain
MELPGWLVEFFSGHHPLFYPVLFFVLSSCSLGTPISADLILLATGYLVYREMVSAWVVVPLAILAVMTGDTLLFQLASRYGSKLPHLRPFKKILSVERISRAQNFYQQHGYRIIFLARFLPGLRTVFIFTAGLLQLRYSKFLAYNFLGASLVIPTEILGVSALAGNSAQLLGWVKSTQNYLLAALGSVALVWIVGRKMRAKESSETR